MLRLLPEAPEIVVGLVTLTSQMVGSLVLASL
jgi:hypothetical protein